MVANADPEIRDPRVIHHRDLRQSHVPPPISLLAELPQPWTVVIPAGSGGANREIRLAPRTVDARPGHLATLDPPECSQKGRVRQTRRVTELALTDARRDELAALLGDEERLRLKHPAVADYLDMAPRLPGTGNQAADAAFDLRFVHYMTEGSDGGPNPYWDVVAPSVSVRDGRRVVDGGHVSGSARLAYVQTILQAAYAYAIPSPESVEWAARFCDGRSLVELGAGRGYWAAQLDRAGVKVHAFDSEPPDQAENVSFVKTSGQEDVWHPVGDLDAFAAQAGGGVDQVLFLCWPPGWGSPMASEALADFEVAGGERLIYVGEPKGGKTGDDAFFDSLAARWKLQSVDSNFVSWWNLNDVAQGWLRT